MDMSSGARAYFTRNAATPVQLADKRGPPGPRTIMRPLHGTAAVRRYGNQLDSSRNMRDEPPQCLRSADADSGVAQGARARLDPLPITPTHSTRTRLSTTSRIRRGKSARDRRDTDKPSARPIRTRHPGRCEAHRCNKSPGQIDATWSAAIRRVSAISSPFSVSSRRNQKSGETGNGKSSVSASSSPAKLEMCRNNRRRVGAGA